MKLIGLSLKNKNYKIKNLYNGVLKSSGGRNNKGICTLRSRNRGVKKLLRIINYKFLLWNISAIVLTIEYAVKKSTYINLICYKNGILSYISATENIKIGDVLNFGCRNIYSYNKEKTLFMKSGDVLSLKNLNEGMFIHNIELKFLIGSQFVRSAGTSAKLIKTNYKKNFALIKLPSGEERLVSNDCISIVGQNANSKHFLKILRKAGQKRNMGIKPSVRGVAMNPIDHPHGGGEGKTSGAGGRRGQVTFNGIPAKGRKTRSKLKSSNYILNYRKK